jgi:hypothetical protein
MNDLTLQYRICFTTLKYGWMDWWKSSDQQRRFLEVRVLNYVCTVLTYYCLYCNIEHRAWVLGRTRLLLGKEMTGRIYYFLLTVRYLLYDMFNVS